MKRIPHLGAMALMVAALVLTGTSDASGQPSTSCGVPPAGYNVIESNAPTIFGTRGNDYICAGDGSSVITARTGHDIVYAGGGNDKVLGNGGNDTIYGGEGTDQLKGGSGDDTIHGGRGADRILGGPNRDTLHGGEGNDHIDGELQADTLFGDDGADRLLGGAGADDLRGGTGDDLLIGGGGNDSIAGGAGIDVADGRGGTNLCTATTVENCDGPLLDAYFIAVDRSYFFRAKDPEDVWFDLPDPFDPDVSRVFSPRSHVILEFWASPAELEKVRPDVRVRTNPWGAFSRRLDEAVPFGTHVAVVDETTGHRVEQTLDLSIDSVAIVEDANHQFNAFVSGNAPAGRDVWSQQKVSLSRSYSFFDQSGSTDSGDEAGRWEGVFIDVGGMVLEFIAVAADENENAQMMYASSASSPTIEVYQDGVVGYGWNPGDEIVVQAEPARALGPIMVDASGSFTTAMDIAYGTHVTVIELGTGITKTLEYHIEVESYTATSPTAWAVVGRGPARALGRTFVSFTDGTSTNNGRFTVEVDGDFEADGSRFDDVDFGVVSIEDEDGDYMSAVFSFIR